LLLLKLINCLYRSFFPINLSLLLLLSIPFKFSLSLTYNNQFQQLTSTTSTTTYTHHNTNNTGITLDHNANTQFALQLLAAGVVQRQAVAGGASSRRGLTEFECDSLGSCKFSKDMLLVSRGCSSSPGSPGSPNSPQGHETQTGLVAVPTEEDVELGADKEADCGTSECTICLGDIEVLFCCVIVASSIPFVLLFEKSARVLLKL
jgi:hypothetical protein